MDWAEAATLLHERGARWPDAFKRSIGVALKDEEDLTFISGRLDALHCGGCRVSDELQLPRAARVFVSFVALLRVNGFAVAPEQTTAFLAAIELLGPRSMEAIRLAGLATLAPAAGAARDLRPAVRHPFHRQRSDRSCGRGR